MNWLRLTRVTLLSLLFVFAACGSNSNQLSGSVSEIYPLDFDGVDVSVQSNFLVVKYTKGTGIALKLTIDQTGLTVQPGQSIDLTQAVPNGTRGTLQQILTAPQTFAMQLGTLTLDQVPMVGASLSGHFRTTLSMPAGRTLNGDFAAVVQQL